MAALLRAYNPRVDVQMVYLPEHALLGVDMLTLNLRGNENEISLNYDGTSYVLLEPTGPAQFSVGEVANTTKLSIRNRQFDLGSLSL
jgi:hypothetical protein